MSGSNLAWLQQPGPGGSLRELALLPQVLHGLQAIRQKTTPPADWADALGTLAAAANAGARPDGVDPADWPALLAEWGALKGKVQGALPDALKPLTFKLSELAGETVGNAAAPGLLTIPLSTGDSVTGASTVGGLAFTTNAQAGATAGLDVQVYDSAPGWAAALDYVLPDARCLVRYGVHGQLTARAGATAAPAWGSVAVGTSAGAGAALDVCFDFPADSVVAQVLIDSAAGLVSPGDLAGVLAASRAKSGFRLSVTELTGDLGLSGKVGVGYGWGVASLKVGAADGQTVDFGARVDVTADVDWAVHDGYRTVVQSEGDGVLLRIERNARSTASTSIALSAVIDVQGLQAALTPLVDEILPSTAGLTAKLGDLLDLQALALKAIVGKLGLAGTGQWDDVAAAILTSELAPAGDKVAATSALSGVLAERFDDLAKACLGNVDGGIDSTRSKIVAAIAAASGGRPLPGDVDGLVSDAVTAVKKAVDAAYVKFTTAVGGAAGELAQALALPGSVVGDELGKAHAQATTLTGPLVAWITSYEGLRKRIAATIARVQQQKLAIAWSHAYDRTKAQSTLVEVRFAAATEASQALFGEMRAGRLRDYARLLADCVAEQSATQTRWLMTDALQRTDTDTLTFNFFGLLATSATIQAIDDVAVSADAMGRVVAASDSISLGAALVANDKLSRASIDLDLQMLAAGAPPPLSSTMSASGDTFSQQDEANFFGLLTDAQAVGGDVAASVRQRLWTGTPSTAATLTGAELSVFFAPDLDGWNRLLRVAPDDLEVKVREQCLRLLGLALKRGDEAGVLDGSPTDWIAGWRGDAKLSDADFWPIAGRETWKHAYESLVDHGVAGATSGSLLVGSPLQRSVQKIWQVRRISTGVAQAWAGLQQVQALLDELDAAGRGGPSKAAVSKKLADLSDGIRTNLAKVFTGVYVDAGEPTRVNWQFLALILALAEIAGDGQPTRLATRAKARIANVDVAYLVV